MARKRQQDFHKTQIKPGRLVAKRKNLTNISFKSKKIVVPNKASKITAKTIPECVKVIGESTHVAAKTSALKELETLIINNKESLHSNLAYVTQTLLKVCIDNDDNLRDIATRILENVLQCSSDLQLKSLVPNFINSLSSAMTNVNMRIKEHSLKILTPMIKLHPNLFAHSTILINYLLQMLSGSPRTRTHSQTPKQILSVMYSDGIYSPHWRIHLLGHINVFLKAMLQSKSDVMNDDSTEQDVYWDAESPLYLEIYAGGGLKPIDIEKFYCVSSDDVYDDSKILELLRNILHIFPAVFTEEMASLPKSDDRLLDGWTISSLNILFQVLCSISEWLNILPSEELERSIGEFLRECMYETGRFPFKKRGAVYGRIEEDFECVELNLSICYLYCSYLLDSKNKRTLCNSVFSYVEDVFTLSTDVKYKSIPLIIKILKIFFQITEETENFLCDSLCQLCSLLKISDGHPNRDLLISLFTKMSLDSAYHFVTETDAMKNWFKWLLCEVTGIPKTGNVDKKILQAIKKIANRRYSTFQNFLSDVDFSVIKTMLRFDDDDVRDAAIFLIYNMKDIGSDLLENIARAILTDSTITMKVSVRLIRVLTYRFSEKPNNGEISEVSIYNVTGLTDIVQFLLNIAIDTYNMNNEKFIDFEANEYTQAVKVIEHVTSYTILPSLHWNEHSILFEICSRFLNQLPEKVVNEVAVKLINEALDVFTAIPMHSAISILKLSKPEMSNYDYYAVQKKDLSFSAMLTTSVLTTMPLDGNWHHCNVTELLNSISPDDQLEVLKLVDFDSFREDQLGAIAAYHILRICNFCVERKLLNEDFGIILKTMENLKIICSNKTIERQPLFIALYNRCSNRHM